MAIMLPLAQQQVSGCSKLALHGILSKAQSCSSIRADYLTQGERGAPILCPGEKRLNAAASSIHGDSCPRQRRGSGLNEKEGYAGP